MLDRMQSIYFMVGRKYIQGDETAPSTKLFLKRPALRAEMNMLLAPRVVP